MHNLFRAAAALITLVSLASAQSAIATNATTSLNHWSSSVALALRVSRGYFPEYFLLPLTEAAYAQLPQESNSSTGIDGTLFATDPNVIGKIYAGDIALTSCEPQDYKNSNMSLADIVSREITAGVRAIIFYSLISDSCNITGDYGIYTPVFTTLGSGSAQAIFERLDHMTIPLNATIMTTIAYNNLVSPYLGQAPYSKAKTIGNLILYAVAGIICFALTIVFVFGIRRIMKYPARYGRAPGSQGQSTARGLARAMLDTLPIVKFGDKLAKDDGISEDAEAGIRHESRRSSRHRIGSVISLRDYNQQTLPLNDEKPALRVEEQPIPPKEEAGSSSCSICTEDFTRGEDIRVLPCDHRYHPACIDPWLLNVSATCPLCRVDLRPPLDEVDSPTQAQPSSAVTQSPETERNIGRRAAARRLFAEVGGMSVDQRINTLRRWRRPAAAGS